MNGLSDTCFEASKLMVVCIDGIVGQHPFGRIQNFCFAEDFHFYGMADLIFTIDGICNATRIPQASFQIRSLDYRLSMANSLSHLTTEERISREKERRAALKRRYLRSNTRGAICTFTLQVIFRQNASFQGRLSVIHGPVKGNSGFRSVLELLYLIADVLQISRKTIRLPSGSVDD